MTRVFYAGIEIQCGTTLEWLNMVRYDGPAYIGTTSHLNIRGVFNPRSMAWRLPGATIGQVKAGQGVSAATARPGLGLGPPAPTAAPLLTSGGQPDPGPDSSWPVSTKEAIEHALSQPRQQLVVIAKNSSGQDYAALVSPALRPDKSDGTTYSCDAMGGPFPKVISVRPRLADKTWLIDMQIETTLDRSELFRQTSSINALFSHRWVMGKRTDQDGYTTRTIKGRAVFRKDRLDFLNASPDDYRSWLLHPCPLGFQRMFVDPVLVADGTALEYIVVDRQMAVTITPQWSALGVTRFEAFLTREQADRGIEQTVYDSVGGLANAAGGIVAATALGGIPVVGQAAMGYAVFNAVSKVGGVVARAIPQVRHMLVVKVWGNPYAKNSDLYAFAQQVATVKLGLLGQIVGQTARSVGVDLAGTFVQYSVVIQAGPLQSLTNVLFDSGAPGSGIFVGLSNDIDGVTTSTPSNVNSAAFPADPIPGALPGPQGARGVDVAGIAAAALWGSCVDPAQPTNPGQPLSKTPTFSQGTGAPVQPQKGIPAL